MMRKILAFLVKHPIWSNVILYGTIGFGLISLFQMRYSFFPEIQSGIITIQVAFPGASPQEVEEGVVLKIQPQASQAGGLVTFTTEIEVQNPDGLLMSGMRCEVKYSRMDQQ